jgi:aspartate carbamoyltransferase catalytic subunit
VVNLINSNYFKGKDFISMRDYGREELGYILEIAEGMKLLEEEKSELLKGKILATLFFEPSTRTRLSFESSMLRLGGGILGFAEPGVSSVAKGESLEDTIRTVESYCDIIAMRHPEEDSSIRAAKVAGIPILNAGSGAWEHPTQAVLDLHAIKTAKGVIDDLTIALVGDLLYGRTVHSLMIALSNYNVKLYLISPPQLKMREDVKRDLKKSVEYIETDDLKGVIPELDVLYATRIQKERFSDPREYERLKDAYLIDRKMIKKGKENLMLMHPLPRVSEISTEVDDMSNAWYFKQVKHGIYVRMAILALALGAV